MQARLAAAGIAFSCHLRRRSLAWRRPTLLLSLSARRAAALARRGKATRALRPLALARQRRCARRLYCPNAPRFASACLRELYHFCLALGWRYGGAPLPAGAAACHCCTAFAIRRDGVTVGVLPRPSLPGSPAYGVTLATGTPHAHYTHTCQAATWRGSSTFCCAFNCSSAWGGAAACVLFYRLPSPCHGVRPTHPTPTCLPHYPCPHPRGLVACGLTLGRRRICHG